jgi:hypothetical protein
MAVDLSLFPVLWIFDTVTTVERTIRETLGDFPDSEYLFSNLDIKMYDFKVPFDYYKFNDNLSKFRFYYSNLTATRREDMEIIEERDKMIITNPLDVALH